MKGIDLYRLSDGLSGDGGNEWRKRRIGDRKYLSERRALCAERSDGSDPDRDFDRESQRRSRAACACEDKRGYSERENI